MGTQTKFKMVHDAAMHFILAMILIFLMIHQQQSNNLVSVVMYDTSDSDDTDLMDALGVTIQYNEAENSDKDTHTIYPEKVLDDGTYFYCTA